MKLFEFAIIQLPEKDRDGRDIGKPTLIEFDRVICKDEMQARMYAAQKIPESLRGDLDRIDIAVRPF